MAGRLLFFALSAGLLAQGQDTLLEPLEILPGQNVPQGTFTRTKSDYIVTNGAAFQGEGPPGSVRFLFGEEEITNIAAFNNDLVARAEAAGSDAAQLEALRDAFLVALQADPQFFPLLFNLGRVYLLLRLPEKAQLYLGRARDQVPEYARTYYYLAQAFRRSGDHRATLYNYRLAYKKNPFDPSALVELGNFYLEQKSGERAYDYFRQVQKGWPGNSDAKIGLARLELDNRNLYMAREILYSIETEDVSGKAREDYNRLLHYYLAIIAVDLRDYAEAVRQFDKLLAHPGDPFFLEVPIMSIQRRRDIAFRLAEAEGSVLQE